MEDAHRVELQLTPTDAYFAVFDGHAGPMAAKWCAQHLHEIIARNLEEYGAQWQVPVILAMSFEEADRELCQLPNYDNSGCTAAVALIRTDRTGRRVYTANVGDARVVLSHNGSVQRLSCDHKPSDPKEIERIEKSGGILVNHRVNGILAVTRAIGDVLMKDQVCSRPYTLETHLSDPEDEFLIIACDGLWDVCGDQDAVNFVRTFNEPSKAAKSLVKHALRLGSTDNVTCLVVQLSDYSEKFRSDRRALISQISAEMPQAITTDEEQQPTAELGEPLPKHVKPMPSPPLESRHFRYGMQKREVPLEFNDGGDDSEAAVD
ncbi:protein phosphatase 2C homolog 1 [Trichomonascus vanleenenianus]|uniref:PP2C family serine/threonine-protein phosphatase n=1 Tax=Trichomonascus vanleenenianus TaxID=2268995 RepID=UPI003ECAD389